MYLLWLASALLHVAYSPVIDSLGSPVFLARERASQIVSSNWPLSEPALAYGRHSPDAEVRFRCRRAAPTWWPRVLTLDPHAFAAVFGPGEKDGLPIVGRPEHGTIRRCDVIELCHTFHIPTDSTYYFGTDLSDTNFFTPPTGVDYLRLRVRGLCHGPDGYPDWSPAGVERMRKLWAETR